MRTGSLFAGYGGLDMAVNTFFGSTTAWHSEINADASRILADRHAEPWMMMLPDGWVTDPAIGLSRNAQLKALGNGVVPPQAFAALTALTTTFGDLP